jgi:parvulin-like peptidyl-prolyl isomerase
MMFLGCQDWPFTRGGARGSAQQGDPGAAAPNHETAPERAGVEIMAYVNDAQIYMSELNDLLVRSHGASMAWLLITSELVAQEAARHNIAVTEADLKAEEEKAVEEAFGFVSDPQQRQTLLERNLARRDISPKQWDLILHRNAALRKLATGRTDVGEEELQKEFVEMYGRKVEIRHIQTDSLQDAQEILKKLEQGADFGELARKHSVNRSGRNGGLLPPIGENSLTVPPPIRRVALGMKKVGEISKPIQAGTAYHILYLEKIIDPQDVKFEDVRDKVEAAARQGKLRAVRDRILIELIRAAKIEYVDPVLKAKTEEGSQP